MAWVLRNQMVCSVNLRGGEVGEKASGEQVGQGRTICMARLLVKLCSGRSAFASMTAAAPPGFWVPGRGAILKPFL